MPPQQTYTMTLCGLRKAIAEAGDIPPAKKAELRSAIATFAKACGQDPSSIIADPPSIRAAIASASPQLAGLSKRSWANTLWRLSKAMAVMGINVHRRRQFKVGPEWQVVLAQLDAAARHDLRRFFGWCTVMDVGPQEVEADTFRSYQAYLAQYSFLSDPREKWHVARRAWNRTLAASGGAYPAIPSDAPPGWRALPWDALPASLLAEIAKYRAHKLGNDPFADKHAKCESLLAASSKPLKPITVDNYLSSLRQFASRLIENGAPGAQFSSLAAFVEIETIKRGLRIQLGDRDLDEARPGLHATMTAILSIAGFLGVEGDHLEELKHLAKKVRHSPIGMCARNKARLTPFTNPEAMRRFVTLPLEIAKRLEGVKSPTWRDAHTMQMSVLLELLLHVPLRVKNAAALRLDRHFQLPVGGKPGPWRLSISKGEVKNDKAIDVEFSLESSAFLARYVSVFRPVLFEGESAALFVSHNGQQKGSAAVSKQFSKFIRRELGLKVNIHLLRHLMAFAYLDARPGDYEGARQLLGHKQVETTIKFYAGMEDATAFRRLDRLIDRLRSGALPHQSWEEEAIDDLEDVL